MAQKEKSGIMNMVKEGISFISKVLSESIFPPLAEGADRIIDKLEDRILHIEKRIWKRIYSFSVISFGLVFLIFALFFYLQESLKWTNAAAFFSIGITLFVIGLILKLREQND